MKHTLGLTDKTLLLEMYIPINTEKSIFSREEI